MENRKHINTDYSVTGRMLCVMPHICNFDGNNMKQVNNIIKTLFHGISNDDRNYTLKKIWIEYTGFNNKNGSFDSDDLIWRRKDIQDGNSHLWHQKYYLPCTKVLDFIACRLTSTIISIGDDERYWGDVKTIEYGKRSSISSDLSDK